MNLKSILSFRSVVPLFAVVSLAAGLMVARELNSFLDIRFASKELPVVPECSGLESSRQTCMGISGTARPERPGDPLPLRIVDEGAIGIRPDPETWGNDYSHNTRAFEHLRLAHPPYVDPAAFAEVEREFHEYVLRMRGMGYNGIVLHGFLDLVDFAYVSGDGVYSEDQSYPARHEALRRSFGRLFRFAEEQGMKVFLYTDMVALTPPLEAYFKRQFGKIDVSMRQLWTTYRVALEELFDRLPEVDGVMIRIGEAGAVHNAPGWDYRSELLVRDPQSLQLMLTELLPVFEQRGKTLIFRTWSVGVGKIGGMHTNPEAYLAALDGVASEALIVSTKYCMGDFDSFLPLNPTLMIGPHRRLLEFQSRREFEGFNAFPNYMGPLHQAALLELLGRNQRIEGAWVWTQGGGPLRAGPLSLYPFSGFWQLVDANVYATARLLERPDSDLFAVTRDWVRDTYGSDPVLNEAITELLLESHSIVEQGLYIRPFAEKQVLAFGLEPPPMMWIFKWDIVDGSSSALSAIYLLSSSDKEFAAAVGEGDVATDRVSRWRQRLATLQDHVRTENRKDFEMLLESLGYQADLFETLSLYRRAFLNFYRWLDRGEEHAYTLWKQAYEQFEQRRSRHESTYAGNLDFPAYSFFAAEAGLLHARRTLAIAWASRIALILGIAAVLGGTPALHPHWPDSPWRHALNGLYCGLFTPWRSPEPAMKKDAALRLLVLVLGTSLLTQALFTSLASPSFLVGIFGMTIALALGMKFALNGPAFDFFGKVVQSEQQERMGRDAFAALALAPLFALALHFLAVLSIRGPLYFWYEFWTRAGFRSGFTVLYVFLFLWLLFAITACGARAAHAAGKRAPLVHGLAATGAGMGAALACLGMLLGFPGLENALTTVNDEMAVLPMGLSRILGIATHLNIPLSLPSRLVGVGVILVVPAAIFRIWARYRKEAKG